MIYYAVIDTNVLVSALLTKNDDAATVKVINYIFSKLIIPLYSYRTMLEYTEVLYRQKFNFDVTKILYILNAIRCFGIFVDPVPCGVVLPDMKDVPFYEIFLNHDNSFLITGNAKHFPKEAYILNPTEFVEIIEKNIIN